MLKGKWCYSILKVGLLINGATIWSFLGGGRGEWRELKFLSCLTLFFSLYLDLLFFKLIVTLVFFFFFWKDAHPACFFLLKTPLLIFLSNFLFYPLLNVDSNATEKVHLTFRLDYQICLPLLFCVCFNSYPG